MFCVTDTLCGIPGFGELDISRKNMACLRDGIWLNDEVRAGQQHSRHALLCAPVSKLSTPATCR